MDVSPDAVTEAFQGRSRPRDAAHDEAMRRRVAGRLFDEDVVPLRIGRFVVVRALGQGGGGTVYEAEDPKLERHVAIKIIAAGRESSTVPGSETGGSPLVGEAKILAKLAHPNVVRVFEVDEYEDGVFVVMELIDGDDLSRWIRDPGRATPRRALRVLTDVARGLRAAHDLEIVHGDIKPSNVLIDSEGRAHLADFGLARLGRTTDGDERTMVAGTPAYMAPEQHIGRPADVRSDVFAFCATAVEVLTGKAAFAGRDLAGLAASKAHGPPVLDDRRIPRRLRAVLRQGLEPDPDQRFDSIVPIVSALETSASSRTPLVIAFGAAAALVGLGVFAIDDGPAPCRGAQRHIDGVWDPAIAAQIDDGFVGTGDPSATAASTQVAAVLDDYAARWVAMHRTACEATRVHGEQSEALLDLRMACLSRRRGELEGVVAVLREPDAEVVRRALEIASTPASIEACADVVRLREDPTGEVADEIRSGLARRLATADAQVVAGRYETAAAALEGIRQDAEQAADHQALTRALRLWGTLSAHVDEPDLALRRVNEAAAVAERVGLDHERAEAYITVARTLSRNFDRHTEALRWLDQVDAILVRVGSGPKAVGGRYRTARAAALLGVGDPKAGRREAQAAVDEYRAVYGDDDYRVARALNQLGIASLRSGQLEAALAAHREAQRINEAVLGTEHPHLLNERINIAGVSTQLGRTQKALENFAEARRLVAVNFPDGHRALVSIAHNVGELHRSNLNYEAARASYREAIAASRKHSPQKLVQRGLSLVGLGRAELGLGNPAAAEAAIQEALDLYAGSEPLPKSVAIARFHLGRAVAARDSVEGRAMVRAALRTMEAIDPKPQAHIDEAETWLARSE